MIAPELFQLNLVRGRGLFARAVMKAQLASPGFTPVFAALVAVVNTKLPENGELILKRVIVAFRRAYKRRDKVVATALAKFIAHMVNQQVSQRWDRKTRDNFGGTVPTVARLCSIPVHLKNSTPSGAAWRVRRQCL